MSNPKGMVVKVLLAYGLDCDWSMAWLAGSRLAVSSARKAWCDAKAAGRCHPRPRPLFGVRLCWRCAALNKVCP